MTINDSIHLDIQIGLIVPNKILLPTSRHYDQDLSDPEWLIHRQANLMNFIKIALESVGLQITSIQTTERIRK